ncbi:MAG: hypothetical protein WA667_21365 [Candidatus Nitrosopolaris sp.]
METLKGLELAFDKCIFLPVYYGIGYSPIMLIKYLSTDELDNSIFYICGPPGMLKAMQRLLQDDLHIPKERIKIEEFTGY